MFSIRLNKGDFYETHTAYRPALIHSTCSSNRQSELKVTHANTNCTTSFKNVIFRHHYVLQKYSSSIETERPLAQFGGGHGGRVFFHKHIRNIVSPFSINSVIAFLLLFRIAAVTLPLPHLLF